MVLSDLSVTFLFLGQTVPNGVVTDCGNMST